MVGVAPAYVYARRLVLGVFGAKAELSFDSNLTARRESRSDDPVQIVAPSFGFGNARHTLPYDAVTA